MASGCAAVGSELQWLVPSGGSWRTIRAVKLGVVDGEWRLSIELNTLKEKLWLEKNPIS